MEKEGPEVFDYQLVHDPDLCAPDQTDSLYDNRVPNVYPYGRLRDHFCEGPRFEKTDCLFGCSVFTHDSSVCLSSFPATDKRGEFAVCRVIPQHYSGKRPRGNYTAP